MGSVKGFLSKGVARVRWLMVLAQEKVTSVYGLCHVYGSGWRGRRIAVKPCNSRPEVNQTDPKPYIKPGTRTPKP